MNEVEPLSDGDIYFLIGMAYNQRIDMPTELSVSLMELAQKIAVHLDDKWLTTRCQELANALRLNSTSAL